MRLVHTQNEQETALRQAMKVAAVVSATALTLAACGNSGSSGSSSSSSGSASSSSSSQLERGSKSGLKVGMAYDVGGRGDQSFNDAAAAGLDKAKSELGVDRQGGGRGRR